MSRQISFLLLLILLSCFAVYSQSKPGKDTTTVNALLEQSKTLIGSDSAKAHNLALEAKKMASEIKYPKGEAYALKNIGMLYYLKGRYVETLDHWNQSLKIFEDVKDDIGMSNMLNNIGAIYFNQGADAKALEYILKSLQIAERIGDTLRIVSALINVGNTYYNKKDPVALDYLLRVIPLIEKNKNREAYILVTGNIGEIYFDSNDSTKAFEYFNKSIKAAGNNSSAAFAYNGIGKIKLKQKKFSEALKNHNTALALAEKFDDKLQLIRGMRGIADVYLKMDNTTLAIQYYNKARVVAEEMDDLKVELKDLYQAMALAYSKSRNYSDAYTYQTLYSDINDTLYNIESKKKLNQLQFDFELSKKEGEINLKEARIKSERQVRGGLIGGLVLILIIAFFIFRNYLVKARINKLLDRQKAKVEQAYAELKETQAQLIQSEKMASLGELTAGIAHEIQNPLNFVNNFSEVSVELIDEMEHELQEGSKDEAIAIASDVKLNLQKIIEHGARADSIIKVMQQHSITTGGQKKLTDINALSDEYLNISYHLFKARENSLEINLNRDFDERIEKLPVVSQEIGRVLLNLYNNAFYAVKEKQKRQKDYKPSITVSTKKIADKVSITVKDNGLGIPQKILDKIFQPFFTTKPTGQGTGLGLSLSYDIITKGHDGEIKVETKEGEYAAFSIILPAKKNIDLF